MTTLPAVTATATLEILCSHAAVFDAELGKPFGLAAGQIAVISTERLEITYVRVVEDTRCPGGMDCESRGELPIEYEVPKNGRSLGLFAIGSNSTGRVIDNYVVNIWDYDGRTVMVQPGGQGYHIHYRQELVDLFAADDEDRAPAGLLRSHDGIE